MHKAATGGVDPRAALEDVLGPTSLASIDEFTLDYLGRCALNPNLENLKP
jgi:hypothetical protein